MKTRGMLVTLLVASGVLYANALHNEFVFDDLTTFRTKSYLTSLATLHQAFDDYRPVRYLSFALDHQLSGDAPWGYHVFNTLYHALSALLVFVTLRRISGRGFVALAGALLFVTHPAHTEAVAYISGRRDVLSTLFLLIGFVSYLRLVETRRWPWAVVLIASFLIAVGAKEMAISLPALCALHFALVHGSTVRRLPRRARLLGAGVGATLVVVAVVVAYHAVTGGASMQTRPHGDSWAVSSLTSVSLVAHYAAQVVAPVHLVADYSFDAYPLARRVIDPRVLVGAGLIVGALVVAYRCRTRSPLVVLGITWFLITLLPVLHIVPFHELAADRHLYLPSVGFCLLAALGLDRIRRRSSPLLAWGALVLVLTAFSVRTVTRNADWSDRETIQRATVAAVPRCARAHLNLGVALGVQGRLSEARSSMERAIEIQPDYVFAHVQLGVLHGKAGRVEVSTTCFEEALRIAYGLDPSPVTPGAICLYLERWGEGLLAFRDQIENGYRVQEALRGSAICFERLDRPNEALAVYERLLGSHPDSSSLLTAAARAAVNAGEEERAVELFARLTAVRATRGGREE